MMASMQVMGSDVTCALADASGNFELNVAMPVVAHNLLQSLTILSNGSRVFADKCAQRVQYRGRLLIIRNGIGAGDLEVGPAHDVSAVGNDPHPPRLPVRAERRRGGGKPRPVQPSVALRQRAGDPRRAEAGSGRRQRRCFGRHVCRTRTVCSIAFRRCTVSAIDWKVFRALHPTCEISRRGVRSIRVASGLCPNAARMCQNSNPWRDRLGRLRAGSTEVRRQLHLS